MAATEQSSEPRRDYASPATWGDVESVRHEVADLRADVARIETGLHAEVGRVENVLHAEIARVETGLRAEIARVETGLRAEIGRVENKLERKIDTGLAEVRTEMVRMEMRLIRWMVATMLAGVGAIGILYGILEAVR